MKFRDKLRRFASEPEMAKQPAEHAAAGEPTLGAVLREGPAGAFWLVETHWPLSHIHGRTVLGQFMQTPGSQLAFLAQEEGLYGTALADMVFLDTETTGLAGGTGTLPFLIGTGRVEGDFFLLRQYLMRDYPDEPAVLEALKEELQQASGLITFNGRRFDWPLLKDRFMLNRVPLAIGSLVHLDLLYPARRLWRYRFHSCSLSSLEEGILGIERQNDLPGSQVPQRYFDYLASGEAGLLSDILHHNVTDILSLAALTAQLAKRTSLEQLPEASAWEAEGFAHLYLRHGQPEEAARFGELGLTLNPDRRASRRLLLHLGRAYKRMHLHAAAANVYLVLAEEFPKELLPYEELAKYYEHVEKDGDRASAAAQQGLSMAQLQKAAAKAEAFSRRLQRLDRKRHQGRSVLSFAQDDRDNGTLF